MKRRRPELQGQPRLRSRVAQEAWKQTGGGTHGGNTRQSNRRDRQAVKRECKEIVYG